MDSTKELPDWTEFYQWGKGYVEIGRGIMPPKLIRVLGIFEKEKGDELIQVAQDISVRESTRVAIIRNSTILSKVQKAHPDWFDKAANISNDCLLLKRGREPVEYVEFPVKNATIFQWIHE